MPSENNEIKVVGTLLKHHIVYIVHLYRKSQLTVSNSCHLLVDVGSIVHFIMRISGKYVI